MKCEEVRKDRGGFGAFKEAFPAVTGLARRVCL